MIPACPLYDPKSELTSKSGYYPLLTDKHKVAASELDDLLVRNRIELDDTDGEIRYLKLLRFLRARGYNVSKAFDMIKADSEWRLSVDMKRLRQQTAQEILQCDTAVVYSFFPTWIQGYDFQSRPVAWRQFGKFEIWNLLKVTTMERLIRFHSWEAEMAIRKMREKTKETGYNIETFVIVIDAAGW